MNKTKAIQKKHALYIRVSTEAQAEEGFSIAAQIERLQAYCVAKGWNNSTLYVDGGYSGSNLNRPQIKQLIADTEAGKLESVIVYKLDRLSRSQKDTLFLIEDVFIPNNVNFISLNESIDTSTPYGRAMIGILSAFAQLERENIYMRTRMGMLERVKQGYWMGGGGTPFGYDYDRNTGTLIPNEDAKTVKKIYELYLKGYSAQKIAKMLDLKYDRLVMQIITRKSNTGVITYKGEEYQGRHEPLISNETYELAMQKVKERASSARVTNTYSHLLTGIIYCGNCGARLRYIRWGKAGYKLICYSHDTSKLYMRKDENCEYEPVWAEQVEKAVLNDLFHISANMNIGAFEESDYEDPIETLTSRISQVEVKIKRLYNLYAESDDDLLFDAIEENKKELSYLQDELNRENETQSKAKRLSSIKSQVSDIASAWEYLSDMEKQMLIRDCVSKIIITNGRIEIFYTFQKKKAENNSKNST